MNGLELNRTMSSREIAQLTGKEHESLITTINSLSENPDSELAEVIRETEWDTTGEGVLEEQYHLTKNQACELFSDDSEAISLIEEAFIEKELQTIKSLTAELSIEALRRFMQYLFELATKIQAESTPDFKRNRDAVDFEYIRDLLSAVAVKKKKQITYLIGDGENYKIGRTGDLLSRFNAIKSNNPNIEIIATCNLDVENELHKRYANNQISGEWFRLDENDVSDIVEFFSVVNNQQALQP